MTPDQQKYYQQLGELRRPLSPTEHQVWDMLTKIMLSEAQTKTNKLVGGQLCEDQNQESVDNDYKKKREVQ